MSRSGNEISSIRNYEKPQVHLSTPVSPLNSGLPFLLFHKLVLQMQMSWIPQSDKLMN